MPSEMRRMAKALVERRSESFASRHSVEESTRRLAQALAPFGERAARLETAWHSGPEGVRLEAGFPPPKRLRAFLNASSLALAAAIVASVWALVSPGEDRSFRFLLPLATLLAIFGFPFVMVALGAQREAEEARMRKAIRRALAEDEEEKS